MSTPQPAQAQPVAAVAAQPDETSSKTASGEVVPDHAKTFLRNLYRLFRGGGMKAPVTTNPSGKPRDLAWLYEDSFPKTSDRCFKHAHWPSLDTVMSVIEGEEEADEYIALFYRELCYRHIYSRLSPTLNDQFDSFSNYVELFNLLLSLNTSTPSFELPTSWLWDMLDDFIYQFQRFHQYRARVSSLKPEDLNELRQEDNEHMWSAQTVMQYLHALVRKAGIQLDKKATEQTNNQTTEDKPAVAPMFRTLGYFSLIGLLRVNSLLCDYQTALKCLDPVDLRLNRSQFTCVLSCHVSLYYYMGLAYLMARRYIDAIKVFCYFLNYMQRNKHQVPRNQTYQAELINKKVEQMYSLLGIAFVLSGAAGSAQQGEKETNSSNIIDENILLELKDKLDDKLLRMRSGELAAFEEVMASAAPKFITPHAPNYDAKQDCNTDAFQLQMKIFLSEVKQRLNMTDLFSVLRLFTAISISQLSVFLHQDSESTLALLLKLNHKNRTQRWVGGSPGEFTWQHYLEVNFAIVKDTIIVTEHRSQRRFGEFFMRQIYKFSELTKDAKSLKPAKKA